MIIFIALLTLVSGFPDGREQLGPID